MLLVQVQLKNQYLLQQINIMYTTFKSPYQPASLSQRTYSPNGLQISNVESHRSNRQTISANKYNNYNYNHKPLNEVGKWAASHATEGEIIKGQSRISYIPFERKIIQYEERTHVQKVPIRRKVIQYQEKKITEQVPRQVVKQDYYAVQYIKQYRKEVVPEKIIEMKPVEKKIKRTQYVPIEKQIVHYPENITLETAKEKSRDLFQQQGVHVKQDAEYRPIRGDLLYSYSNQYQNGEVKYAEEGFVRPFSNMVPWQNHNSSRAYSRSNYSSSRQKEYGMTTMKSTPQQSMKTSNQLGLKGQMFQSQVYSDFLNGSYLPAQ